VATRLQLARLVATPGSEAAAGGPLDAEERQLLAAAYREVVGERRAAWRHLCRLELQKEDGRRPEGALRGVDEPLATFDARRPWPLRC
jgi:hypothetical protein